MTEPKPLRVLIIGSGVAGLTLGLSLLRLQLSRPHFNLSVKIVDAASRFDAAGAAFCLSPNGTRPLAQLGLLPKLLEKGQVLTGVAMHEGWSKKTVQDIPMPPTAFGGHFIAIERSSIQEILLSEIRGYGIDVHMKKRYKEITENTGENTLRVVYEDDTTDDADIVVGADGVRSRVRDFVLAEDEDTAPCFSGWSYVAGISSSIPNLPAEETGKSHWCIANSGKGGYGTWSLPDNRQFWYVLEPDEIAPRGPGTPMPRYSDESLDASVQRAKQYWHPFGTFSQIVERSDRMYKSALVERHYPRIVSKSGNVVLIGDAAHPMWPYIGQGANASIEDAVILANALLPRSGEVRGTLWYQEQRVDRTARIMRAGGWVGRLQMGETVFWRIARSLSMMLLRLLAPNQASQGTAQQQEGDEGGNRKGGPLDWIHKEDIRLEL